MCELLADNTDLVKTRRTLFTFVVLSAAQVRLVSFSFIYFHYLQFYNEWPESFDGFFNFLLLIDTTLKTEWYRTNV